MVQTLTLVLFRKGRLTIGKSIECRSFINIYFIRNQTMKKIIAIFLASMSLVGCTLDTYFNEHSYQSQNYININSSTMLGAFTYEPAKYGRVKENQIENTALGSIYLDRNLNEIVKQITATELKLTGIQVGTGKLKLFGNIKQFKIDDLGYSADSHYIINYKIMKNNDVVWDKDYVPGTFTVSKFTLTEQKIKEYIFRVIGAGYEKFINDNGVKRIFEENK